jgi:hypothetical protein
MIIMNPIIILISARDMMNLSKRSNATLKLKLMRVITAHSMIKYLMPP